MILALDLAVVGKKDPIFSEEILKKKRLTIQKVQGDEDDVTTTNPEETPDSPLPLRQYVPSECSKKTGEPTLPKSNCNGNVCYVYGVHFNQCVCLSHPVSRIDLESLVSQCHFLEGQSYGGMENKSKRLAYYYHYAVNVYMISAKGNRCNKPVCLKLKICELYPNAPGVPYSDEDLELGSLKQKKR